MAAGFFVQGEGGGGIAEVEDEATFDQMMHEWPLFPYTATQRIYSIAMETALAQAQATYEGSPDTTTTP